LVSKVTEGDELPPTGRAAVRSVRPSSPGRPDPAGS